MEVHAHTHDHGKKSWKAYFWEFFMLFLAVTLGFFVENQREHLVEHQREKEYARSLYDEFLADSIAVANKITARLEKERDCDSLKNYIRDSSLTELPKAFYPAFTTVFYLFNSYTFEPKDGVLNQLKSSGSLRYFKNQQLQKLFGDISVAINNVRNRTEQEYQFFASPIKPYLTQHYDFSWIDELRKNDPEAYVIDLIRQYRSGNSELPAQILNLKTFDRSEAINIILFYKTMVVSTRTLQMKDYIKANHEILEELRQEFKLK